MTYIVVAVDRKHMLAFLVTNESNDVFVLPITTLYDCYGDETKDWKEAVQYVCGSGDLFMTVRAPAEPVYH